MLRVVVSLSKRSALVGLISDGSIYGDEGAIDLKKKLLIDVWDWDPPPFSHDFMAYLEVSLEELIQKAQDGAPLKLKPPPEPHKQQVGCLYVDRALLALPQVIIDV